MRETCTRTIKKDIISSELNEDGDAGANGERVKSKDRNRRGEKDESLKGRHRIGQLLGPSLTLALTRQQLGQKGVQEGAPSVALF